MKEFGIKLNGVKRNGGNPKGFVRPERLELPWETPLGPQSCTY